MIYPQNFEQKTGFDKVRRLISEKCLSPLGEERVAEMEFSADYQTVTRRLEQTDEFVRILHGEDEFPASYFFDVRYSLKRIRPEGTWLDEKELFDLKRSLQTINDIIRFFRPSLEEGEEIKYPALTALAGDIQVFPQLIGKIDAILDKFGRVKDNASPSLAQIRKEITATMSGISRSLQSILRAAQSEGVVDKDITPTMRDGRLMIPVAPAFKRKIKGIVHDESASGKTVFIEPEVVVEANNRIRELEGDERREIMKILTEFTNFIRPLIPDILQSYEFLAEIDFIRAKALFAEQINGIKPVIEDKQQIDWIHAAHPLLFLSLQKQNKQIVPLDILLEEKKRLLIISGPNAGGKSVCLKTVGLLQYMLQCGLLIPVYESSKTGLFENMFIDIGDEQSIENDLSTYSSHLTNMKFFVKNCNSKTLILIDEFGSGTEPQIGGAIAEALLDRFNRNHLADQCIDLIVSQFHTIGGNRNRINILDSTRNRSACHFLNQQSSTLHHFDRLIRIQAAFIAERSIRIQTEATGCLTDPSRMESGRFQEYILSLFRHTGIESAKYTGDTHRLFHIANHQITVGQRTFHTIERHKLGTFRRRAYHDFITFDLIGIERVQRLSYAVQDIVRNIHHVINGTQADHLQTVLQPFRTFLYSYIFNRNT